MKQNNLFAYIYSFFEYYITKNISEIKNVGLYFNQLETGSDSKSVPRILIEIQPVSNNQLFGGLREYILEITFHLYIEIFNNIDFNSELKQTNLNYLSTLDNILNSLTAISSYNLPLEEQNDLFLIHNVESTDIILATNEGSLKESTIGFRMIVEDRSNVKKGFIKDEIEFINSPTTFIK